MSAATRSAQTRVRGVAATASPSGRLLPALTAALVVFVPSVLSTRAANPFSVVELAVLGVLSAAGLIVWAWHVGSRPGLRLPDRTTLISLGALAAALIAATAASDRPWLSVVGAESRNSGLLLYLACIVALLMAYASVQLHALRLLLPSLAAMGALQVLIGTLQLLGMDWPDLTQIYATPLVGTLGNPNFASALLGIVTPVLAWLALREQRVPLRAAGGVLAIAAVGLGLASGSIQGPVAAVAGLAVLAVIGWLPLVLPWLRARRRGRGRWELAAGLAAGLALLLLFGRFVMARGTLEIRLHYWDIAWRIFRDNPLLGVGLDRYGASFTAARSQETLEALGPTAFTNAAHNVPLQIATGGGLLLLLAYLAFVLIVGWALVSGVRRHQADDPLRWALGASGGAWIAYQVQSLVSIDQPPLALLHFVLAGIILAISWGGRQSTVRRNQPGRLAATVVAATVVGAALGYLCLLPVRSELAIREGNLALRAQDPQAALRAFETAGKIAGWDPRPSFYRGQLLDRAGHKLEALPLLVEAASDEPGSAAYGLAAATEAVAAGDGELARRFAEQALKADPRNPETRTDAAIILLSVGDVERGRTLLEDVVAEGSALGRTWAGLGDARKLAGDLAGARLAYEQALALEPGNEAIRQRMQQLSPPG